MQFPGLINRERNDWQVARPCASSSLLLLGTQRNTIVLCGIEVFFFRESIDNEQGIRVPAPVPSQCNAFHRMRMCQKTDSSCVVEKNKVPCHNHSAHNLILSMCGSAGLHGKWDPAEMSSSWLLQVANAVIRVLVGATGKSESESEHCTKDSQSILRVWEFRGFGTWDE